MTYEIFKIKVAPNFYYGRRGTSPDDLEIVPAGEEYPKWKVDSNISATVIGMLAIYVNQFINILIIHIQLKRNYSIEIYGWALFCARGKLKA
jgi:hypothetical protein